MSRSRALADKARQQADAAYHEFWATVVECSEIFKKIASNARQKVFLASVIKKLYDQQDGVCPLCGEPIDIGGKWEVDHVIPHSRGGGNERENLQLVHQKCNRSKGKKVDPHALLRYLEDRAMNLGVMDP